MPSEPSASSQNADLAAQILHNVRASIPLAIEQLDVMLQLLSAARPDGVGNFLDLGCGDGVLAATILNEHPHARGTLVELAESQLAGARRRLHASSGRAEFLVANYREPAWVRALQRAAPFDAVVFGFAAQHLPTPRKRQLFGEIFHLLKPEGLFLHIEHVASPTRWTESVWDDHTIDAIFGQQLKASPGKSRAEIARDYYAQAAMTLAPLEVQCDWLREHGFENVDCYLKVQELAVFGGQKPAA